MRQRLQKAYLIFFGCLLGLVTVQAQESNKPAFKWSANGSTGFSNWFSDDPGFVWGADFAMDHQNWSYGVSYYSINEWSLFGPFPLEHFDMINLNLGKQIDHKPFQIRYSAGVGAMWGSRRTDQVDKTSFVSTTYVNKKFLTPIIHGGLEGRWYFLDTVYFGLSTRGVVSTQKSLYLMPLLILGINIRKT